MNIDFVALNENGYEESESAASVEVNLVPKV